MTELANEIYKELRRRVRAQQGAITYRELAAAVAATTPIHHRNPKLYAALGEVSEACRSADLPCLPAVVWSASLKRPADGYYAVAHPRARSEKARVAAWEREHERVLLEAERFPKTL